MELTIFVLAAIFLILLFTVSRGKGFRSALSLVLTIIILLYVIVPLIDKGYDPTLVVLLAALPIVILIVYLTEGFTALAHVSIAAIILNFFTTAIITYAAVAAAHLTGVVSDDASYLGLTGVNLQQLLIAGMMLGTLGILTEMVVTQAATVMELIDANPQADQKSVYRKAYTVGVAHLGSIINTLFLVYAGVSLPLLIIYASGQSSLSAALNYEPLASDIIRTLTGTIGLIIAMPLSTVLAAWWLKQSKS